MMRSTVRIDDDLMLELKQRARDESVSLTRMLNRALRAGLFRAQQPGKGATPFRQQSEAMGQPRVDIDKALALAARLEDEEVARKLSLRK